jgi:threonine synthase
MEKLECLSCKKQFRLDVFTPFCPVCQEPLFYYYPDDSKKTIDLNKDHPLERYADFLPLKTFDPRLSLGEGNTPLVKLEGLARKFHLPATILAKNEMANPTFSFKDRGTAVAIQKAVSLGIRKIGTVSTGNMAASTAAYGARAGLETFVLLKEGTSPSSLLSAGIYQPRLIAVEGDYPQLYYQSFALGRKFGIYFMNSIDPFRVEGYKVTGYEIFRQLGLRTPRAIILPLSAGGHLLGIMGAFLDLLRAGTINEIPVIIGVQAEGCSPLARAFAAGAERYERISKARTIAHAISNPAPAAGNIVLRVIRENKGMIVAVSDEEILAAQKTLAEVEGIFCQPESAAALAALLKIRDALLFKEEDSVVLIITGSGLKNLGALDSLNMTVQNTNLVNLEGTLRSLS